MTATLEVLTAGRSLLRPDIFDFLARQIVSNEEVEQDYAEDILDQSLAFIKACADNPGAQLRPSRAVDVAWHTFILNTAEYAIFCQRIAGRFIHHLPEEFTPPASPGVMLSPTVAAMRAAGFAVKDELWAQASGKCSQCHQGCTNCGQGGKLSCDA
jgi:hypothetical protein